MPNYYKISGKYYSLEPSKQYRDINNEPLPTFTQVDVKDIIRNLGSGYENLPEANLLTGQGIALTGNKPYVQELNPADFAVKTGLTGRPDITYAEGSFGFGVLPSGVIPNAGTGTLPTSNLANELQAAYQSTKDYNARQRTATPQTQTLADITTPNITGVYRDNANNFYVIENGQQRKIELPEFQSLGINETFVRPGQTVSLEQAKTGQISTPGGLTQPGAISGATGVSTGDPVYDKLLGALQGQLEELKRRGQVLNPDIEITPEQMAEFTAQAQREIDPYYSTQLQLARESILRDFGYTAEDVLRNEKQLEQKYGLNVRQLGETAAEKGFALSGQRREQERLLAEGTQQDIEQRRRELSFGAGTAARQFAQQYGPTQFNIPTLTEAPRVLAGQGSFERGTRQLPFYELSSETYEGLVGTKQFEQRGMVRSRASELEEAFRRQEALRQARQLTL